MKERGILFKDLMVRAAGAGTKTQTRRVVKWRGLEPGLNLRFTGLQPERSGSNWVLTSPTRTGWAYRSVPQPCPYGLPGDRLWVRESFRFTTPFDKDSPSRVAELCLDAGYPKPWAPIQYEADDKRDNWTHVGTPTHRTAIEPGKLRPGIHMPRWASRITLEIVSVRIERLWAITEEDAQAEGLIPLGDESDRTWSIDETARTEYATARDAYLVLWERIHGVGSWEENPFVWVVSFRRINR